MNKIKKNIFLLVITIVFVILAAGLLIGNILLTAIPYRLAYARYNRSLLIHDTALGVLVIVFSGISLLLSAFLFFLRRNKIVHAVLTFFTFAAGGVSLGLSISNTGYFYNSQEIVLLVFGALEILIGVIYVVIILLGFINPKPKAFKSVNALKSLDALKEQGILTEEEYNSKKELIKEKEQPKVDPNVCPHCGNKKHKGDKFCSKCGYKFEDKEQVSTDVKEPTTALTQVAQVFFYIGAIITCVTVIGLCWALPMIHIYKRDRDTIGKHSIAFKICTLLFISEIGGILMLIDYKH